MRRRKGGSSGIRIRRGSRYILLLARAKKKRAQRLHSRVWSDCCKGARWPERDTMRFLLHFHTHPSAAYCCNGATYMTNLTNVWHTRKQTLDLTVVTWHESVMWVRKPRELPSVCFCAYMSLLSVILQARPLKRVPALHSQITGFFFSRFRFISKENPSTI